MNKTNKLTDYGNGILASDDFLASIARECIEREMMQRQCRIASHDSVSYGTFNISDRH
jgi:hypothetical protein